MLTSSSSPTQSTFTHESFDSLNFKEGTAFAIQQTLTYGATINWDTRYGQLAVVTLTGATATVAAPTNMISGAFYNIEIRQDGNGSRVLVWNSIFKFANNAAPTLTPTASYKDFITFKFDGTNLCEQGRSQGIAP